MSETGGLVELHETRGLSRENKDTFGMQDENDYEGGEVDEHIYNSEEYSTKNKFHQKHTHTDNNESTLIVISEDNIFSLQGVGLSLKCFFQFIANSSKSISVFLIVKNIALILGVFTYILTLEGCEGTVMECTAKYSLDELKKAVNLMFLSSFFFTLQFYLDIAGIVNRSFSIMVVITLFFLCFVYDTGADFKSHGAYNRVLLFILMAMWCIPFLIFHIYVFSHSKKFKLGFTIVLIFSYFFVNSFYGNALKNSCDGWSVGFKGMTIDNNSENDHCKILPPNYCYFRMLYGFFDQTKLTQYSCRMDVSNKFDTIKPFLPTSLKESKRLGYPKTNAWKMYPDSLYDKFQGYIFDGMVDMDKADEESKANVEAYVDFSKERAELIIQLKRNEKLAEERAAKFKTDDNKSLSPNVVHIFIDSLSRPNFKMKLPKLFSWLESKYISNPSKDDKDKYKFESFNLLKFHGVGMYTGFNIVPALFGTRNNDSNGKYFLTHFKERGYITGQSLNHCSREFFEIERGAIEWMRWDYYDHELVAPMCDTNINLINNAYSILLGVNSIRKRCLYGKNLYEHSFEYMTQFFDAYKNDAKYFRIAIYDGHEGTGELIKYADDRLTQYFVNFEKQGYLDNTIILFHSDHGLAMLGPYSIMGFEDYKHELVLPAFFIIIPTSIRNYDEIRETLRHNQNSLVTPFNIFNSLLAITDYENKKNHAKDDEYETYDLFTTKIPKTRNCKSFNNRGYYSSNPSQYFCRCTE